MSNISVQTVVTCEDCNTVILDATSGISKLDIDAAEQTHALTCTGTDFFTTEEITYLSGLAQDSPALYHFLLYVLDHKQPTLIKGENERHNLTTLTAAIVQGVHH